MDTIEKIRKVLIAKGIVITSGKRKGEVNLTAAARKMQISQGTLIKAFQRKDGDLHPSTQDKFIITFHVAREWWETGRGDIFEEKAQKVTPVTKPEGQTQDYPDMMSSLLTLTKYQEKEIKQLEKDKADLLKELEEYRRRSKS